MFGLCPGQPRQNRWHDQNIDEQILRPRFARGWQEITLQLVGWRWAANILEANQTAAPYDACTNILVSLELALNQTYPKYMNEIDGTSHILLTGIHKLKIWGWNFVCPCLWCTLEKKGILDAAYTGFLPDNKNLLVRQFLVAAYVYEGLLVSSFPISHHHLSSLVQPWYRIQIILNLDIIRGKTGTTEIYTLRSGWCYKIWCISYLLTFHASSWRNN
jgi:hypothetical protein